MFLPRIAGVLPVVFQSIRILAAAAAFPLLNFAAEILPELPELPLTMPETPASPQEYRGAATEITITAQRIYRDDNPIDLSRDTSIVTSVNRMVESAANSGTAFTVITGQNMENQLSRSLSDVLRGQTGVTINSTGGPGSSSSIMIRGAASHETAVLLDGVRLNNQVADGGSGMFNLHSFTPMNLSQVSVLRGANSVLYGSQAMGGAVDMQLRKGQGKATGSFATELGAGENLYYRERLQSQGGNDKFNYSLAAVYQGTDGLRSSAIPDEKRPASPDNPKEADGFWSHGYNSRFGITPAKNVELSLTTLYEFSHGRIDDDAYVESVTNFNENEILFVRPKLWTSFCDGLFESELGFAYIEQQYYNENAPTKTALHFDGHSYVGDWKGTLKLPRYSTTVVGVDFRVDSGDTYGFSWGTKQPNFEKSSVRQTDVFIQQQLRFFEDDRWVTNFGARMANHETFGTYTTWHADSVFHLFETGTSFKVSAGTGFKAPTLFELYAPSAAFLGGNPDLTPETSFSWEAGITQSLFNGKDVLSATYFHNHFHNMISYNSADMEFQNYANVVTRGVELSNTLRLFDCAELITAYTYLDTRNYDDTVNPWSPAWCNTAYNKMLACRPNHQFSAMLNLELLDKRLNLNTQVVYYGRCYGDAANRYDREVSDAWEWNTGASYKFNSHLRVYGKLNNLLGANFCRSYGYQSEGFNGFAGLEVSF